MLKINTKCKKIVSNNHFQNFHQVKTKNKSCENSGSVISELVAGSHEQDNVCDLPVIDYALKNRSLVHYDRHTALQRWH
jgi:hypothetical protein